MKKPIYKNWWFILGVFLIIGVISGISNNIKGTTNTAANQEQVKEISEEDNIEEISAPAVDPGITKEYIESKLANEQVEILNIDNSGDNYYSISFKVRDVVSSSYYKKNILGEIKQICQLLTENGLVDGNEFFFEAKGPGADKYGNELEMNYATAFVKGDELAKCNFDNLSSEGFEFVLQSFGLDKSIK